MKDRWKLAEISACLYAKDLTSGDKEKRKYAIEKLVRLGQASFSAMEEIIEGNSSNLEKLGSISILKKIGGEKAVNLLLKLLKERNLQLRNKAISVLGEMKAKESIYPLIEMLKSVDVTTRTEARKALSSIGARHIMNPLLSSMLDSNPRLFQSGEELIFSIKNDAEQLLLEKLEDKNLLISSLAIEMLGKLKCRKALEPVRKLLKKKDSILIKQASIEALGLIGDAGALPEILQYTDSDNKLLREKAGQSLGELAINTSIPHVKKLLKDECPDVRLAAVKALGKMKDSSSVETLMEMAEKSSEADMREEAVKALGKIGDMKAGDLLINKLYDQSEYVRLAAIEALGDMNVREALPHLIKLLENDEKEFVRRSAGKTIMKIGA